MTATVAAGAPERPYRPLPGLYDEALTPAGEVRAHYAPVLARLAERGAAAAAGAVAAAVRSRRITFGARAGVASFALDAVPRLLTAAEWAALERGLAQRVRALNAFLADAHGERRIVAAGRVPDRVLSGAEHREPAMEGTAMPFGVWAGVAGLDLVRGAGGGFAVLEDNLRTPSGIAYAMAAREVTAATLGAGLPPPKPIAHAIDLLDRALRRAAPGGREDPAVAVLSDGPRNSAWWEHRRLAAALGVPLVVPQELSLRRGRLVARLPEGERPLDVLLRRTDEDRLHDRGGRPTPLAGLLLEPLRRGTLVCVNAFGAGLADDKLVHAYVEEMIRFYLGEEPLVPSVRTHDLAEPGVRAGVLDRIGELVVKPRAGFGGQGVVIGPHATREDRERVAGRVRRHPDRFVAQETVALSVHPTVVDGVLAPRHVDLRPFVLSAGDEVGVIPGGLTRVAFGAGALVVNSSQNGGAKDTWVLDH